MESSKTLEEILSSFNRMPIHIPLPDLKSTATHTVLFNGDDIQEGKSPDPYPQFYEDKWDEDHVHMPCSLRNVIKVKNEDGHEEEKSMWEIIKRVFSESITSLEKLQDAMSKYDARYKSTLNLNCLKIVLEKEFNKEQKKEFMTVTLPGIIKLALQLPSVCTQAIPLLKSQKEHAITLSQKQIGCLLANAFLSTFPRNLNECPNINFSSLLSAMQVVRTFREHRRIEKLKCILNYFQRIISKEPVGTITFHRRYLHNPPNWSTSKTQLRNLYMSEKGTIEKEGTGMLQVDFADEYIGGLVLQGECAQEEVLFIISPELIISRLFTPKLEDEETLLITGYEQHNKYSGYEHTFQWEGDFCDNIPRDKWGRKFKQMIAMDALCMSGSLNQFRPSIINRELNKAFCGFSEPDIAPEMLPAVASGKWGCGVFGGDATLKSLIQLMAASEAKRDLVLFTFDDYQLKQDVTVLYSILIKNNVTVGKLWNLLNKYYQDVVLPSNKTTIQFLRDFISEQLQVHHKCDM